MLEHCKSATERWGGVSQILDKWFSQRQELIVEFCTVSGVHEFRKDNNRDPHNGLRTFCELMVDYISAGHFEVYDHLIQEAEEFGDGSALDLAKKLYPKISATTEKALAFNDQLDAITSGDDHNIALAHELSVMGETLVARFELEDQLVEALHYAHKDLIATA